MRAFEGAMEYRRLPAFFVKGPLNFPHSFSSTKSAAILPSELQPCPVRGLKAKRCGVEALDVSWVAYHLDLPPVSRPFAVPISLR